MGQNDILLKIKLLLFNDDELKRLMAIPEEHYDDLIEFRDNYCVTGLDNAPDVITSDTNVRLIIGWHNALQLQNTRVFLRKFGFEIYVQKTFEYDDSVNVLNRRAELIINRIIKLLNNKRIDGFLIKVQDMGDLNSFSYDFTRSFVTFDVKNIF